MVPRTETGLEILATLQAEEVSAYEMVYRFDVAHEETSRDKESNDVTLHLDRSEPHPVLGDLQRPSAASFYEALLRESEGERLELVANDSADPFDYKGVRLAIVTSPESDEDALVVRSLDRKPIPSRGWVRPRSDGTRALVQRKRSILQTASRKRHIVDWFAPGDRAEPESARESIVARVVDYEGVFCVQGPPGTGKTHLACDVVQELLRKDPHARILVCAKEHNALHLLRNRVIERLGPSVPQASTVERGADASDPTPSVADKNSSAAWASEFVHVQPPEESPPVWLDALKRWDGHAPPILGRTHQKTAQILFATTTAAAVHEELGSETAEPYDLVVVEEAGKCYPSELLSVLVQGRSALLIGDQRQLPPFQMDEVASAVDDLERLWGEEEGRARLLEHNPELFEGIQAMPSFSWTNVRRFLLPFRELQELGRPAFMLADQYRMVPVLSDMVSSIFYPRKFAHRRPAADCTPLFHHRILGDLPLVWVDIPHSTRQPRAREDPTGERFSEVELSTVAAIVRELTDHDGQVGSIAILSPYNAQVDRLAGRSGIPSRLPSKVAGIPGLDPRTRVRTVDSFQGNEADLVILSLVRNNPFGTARNAWGFLSSPERLNVMLSRARRQLVIVGCAQHVRLHATDPEMEYLAAVLDYVEKHGRIVDLDSLGVRP